MSDISREEAIDEVKKSLAYGYLDISNQFEKECMEVVSEAISKMEKLEKIEQMLDKTYYNICNSCSDSALIDCKYCEFNMIRQIIKSE